MNAPSPILQHQAFQQVIPAGSDLIVPGLLKPGVARTIADRQQSLQEYFPVQRQADHALPLLPYLGLAAEFRQLLLEINTSHTIRLIEKTLSASSILPDTTFLQAGFCSPEESSGRIAAMHGTRLASGLLPAIACSILLGGMAQLGEHALQPGDAWLVTLGNPRQALAGTVAGSSLFMLFFYHFKSRIPHEKIEVR